MWSWAPQGTHSTLLSRAMGAGKPGDMEHRGTWSTQRPGGSGEIWWDLKHPRS